MSLMRSIVKNMKSSIIDSAISMMETHLNGLLRKSGINRLELLANNFKKY